MTLIPCVLINDTKCSRILIYLIMFIINLYTIIMFVLKLNSNSNGHDSITRNGTVVKNYGFKTGTRSILIIANSQNHNWQCNS